MVIPYLNNVNFVSPRRYVNWPMTHAVPRSLQACPRIARDRGHVRFRGLARSSFIAQSFRRSR
jgi:hypothetical protein